MRRALALLAVLSLAACGGGGPSRPDPLAYLRVGVEPRAEARAVAEGLEEAGYEVGARLEGRTFAAFDAHRASDGATAVRVVTARGIALALDAPNERADALSLVRPPGAARGELDLDGDGREELAVVTHDRVKARDCLVLLRVKDDGTVERVGLEAPGLREERPCIVGLRDVGGDERPEALVAVRHPALARTVVPSVRLPFAGRAGRWEPARGEAHGAFWREAVGARRRQLAEARERRDVETAYRLAVELASIAHLRGEPMRAQVRAFDEALRGLVLEPDQARSLTAARAHVAAGWRQ